MQNGDVQSTEADIKNLYEYISFRPHTNIKVGIKAFISWFKAYYKYS